MDFKKGEEVFVKPEHKGEIFTSAISTVRAYKPDSNYRNSEYPFFERAQIAYYNSNKKIIGEIICKVQEYNAYLIRIKGQDFLYSEDSLELNDSWSFKRAVKNKDTLKNKKIDIFLAGNVLYQMNLQTKLFKEFEKKENFERLREIQIVQKYISWLERRYTLIK